MQKCNFGRDLKEHMLG